MASKGEMRHFGPASAGDPLSTPASVRRLEQVAVPWQVAPYFSTAVARVPDPWLRRRHYRGTPYS
ncbi:MULTISPECIES: hypothetical protein [Streptomyces]|uniref:hypothetical protein n=1 Tax=Streptomyces TaxID=1883 RepID=UPI000B1A47BA|nr:MULTISPECIES: hypothetical protein [Streptomyces]